MRRPLLLGGAVVALVLASLQACGTTGDDATTGEELASNVHVLTQHNDTLRSGFNGKETRLTPGTVTPAAFGKLFARNVDGAVYAQPLYVGGVNGKNVVFVATEHNSVYAFDADNPAAQTPLWTVNLGPSVPSRDTGCGLLSPEIGITGTPVIDLDKKTIWLVAKTKESGVYKQRLHALDIATGAAKPGSPVEIKATAPGDGGGSIGGVLTMDPLKHLNRPGLLKVGERVYVGFGSNCDIDPYHGWIVSFDATTLQEKAVHVDTPNGDEGGIWHAGVGLPADENGDVYYVSGNGTFDGATNVGNSMVRLHAAASGALSIASFFTPGDSAALNDKDLDLGSTGGMLIPGTKLAIAGDKAGIFYLVQRDTMGGLVSGDGQIVQKFHGTIKGAFGGLAYYPRGKMLYAWGTGDRLKAYAFDGARFDPTPTMGTVATTYPGGQLSVSANGDVAGTGILWTVRSAGGTSALSNPGAGILQAFEATNIQHELWSSAAKPQNALGNLAKFAAPTIANGRVYVGTGSNQLVVYGLFNTALPEPDAAAPDTGSDAGVDAPPLTGPPPTWTDLYAKYFGPSSLGHCSNTGCHASLRAGFKCGASKSECYLGLVSAGLVDQATPSASKLGKAGDSPLSWFGGSMPLDDPSSDAEAAAAITAWIGAGAKDN